MKLERLFEVRNSCLYRLGTDCIYEPDEKIQVKWSDVEPVSGEYNEAYLASLRDTLKLYEENKTFVFIEPLFDIHAPAEHFVAAMKHTARRIKDCVSVIGFAIPKEIESQRDFYMAELLSKHKQYCFFSTAPCESTIVGYTS